MSFRQAQGDIRKTFNNVFTNNQQQKSPCHSEPVEEYGDFNKQPTTSNQQQESPCHSEPCRRVW